MASRKKLTERQITKLVRNIVKESTSVDSTESASSEVMSPLDQQASYAKLKEFFKDYYQNIKQKLTDVSPSEFNEIEMVLNAVISLAREYNLNNKDPEIIAQQLKRHMRDIQRTDKAAEKKAPDAPDTPAPKYGEVKESYIRSNFNRLYKRLKR